MDIRKITKTDKKGKRLFVEIGKNAKERDCLPSLKQGDEVLTLVRRRLDDAQMNSLVGKCVQYFFVDDDSSLILEIGTIKTNEEKFWKQDDEDYWKKKKYALVDEEGPLTAFDDLNDVYDLQIVPISERLSQKTKCSNRRCKKQFPEIYKYCPHCGRKNIVYNRGDKRGKVL